MINFIYKMCIALFLLISINTVYAQDPQKAKMSPSNVGYLEYLPAGYAASSQLYPAIIFLHGSGERGDGSPAQLTRVTNQGIPKLIKNGSTMCFTVSGKTECFIVLSPQTNAWGWQKTVVPFAQWALQNYRIDPDRLYVTGLSMGGQGAWVTGSDVANDPNLFAAIASMSGKGATDDGAALAQKHIPMWAFHGLKDTSISYYEERTPVNGMIACNASPAPILTEYPDTDHGQTWDRAYTPDHTYHNPNVYEWFLSNKRVTPVQKSPVVNAGVDASLTLPVNTINLIGKATDADGTIASTVWKKWAGPSCTISSPGSLTTTVTGLVKGGYMFTVTSTDNSGASTTDVVNINVLASTGKVAPVATAGNDRTINSPLSSISLTGSGTDSDGTISSYLWKQDSGPSSATLAGTSTATLQATNLSIGSYTFSLTVTDNDGLTGVDQVVVNVLDAAPVSNAGVDKVITSKPPCSITLTGSGTDVDGTVTSYLWKQDLGPNTATLAQTTSPTLLITNMVTGAYAFSLTVTDNYGISSHDQVLVNVSYMAPLSNDPPVVNAGADQTINLPVTSGTINAVATDDDGIIASYLWTKIGGGSITMNGSNTSTLQISNAAASTYIFKVVVTDDMGNTAADTVHFRVNGVLSVTSADQSIILPVNATSFVAKPVNVSGMVTYAWQQVSGGVITMAGVSTNTLKLSNATQGLYSFKATITNNGTSVSTTMQLTVNAAGTSTALVSASSSGRVASNAMVSTEEEKFDLSLGQNYPNPFSSITTIPLSLDQTQHIVLKVYNANGNEIATIVNEDLPAGEHTFELNATALNTQPGIYFYKVFTNAGVLTKKLMYL